MQFHLTLQLLRSVPVSRYPASLPASAREQRPIVKPVAESQRAMGKTKPARRGRPVGQSDGRRRFTTSWSLSLVSPSVVPFKDRCESGGADEIRTRDLRRAKAALSQLSYGPSGVISLVCHRHASGPSRRGGVTRMVVGHSGLEPEASVLSGLRSNQLS